MSAREGHPEAGTGQSLELLLFNDQYLTHTIFCNRGEQSYILNVLSNLKCVETLGGSAQLPFLLLVGWGVPWGARLWVSCSHPLELLGRRRLFSARFAERVGTPALTL